MIATNPAHSWIHQQDFRELLGTLDFLVVQDMYHSTETALAADLVLPAAGWGEKEGTFINSERRVGLLKKVKRAPARHSRTFTSSSLRLTTTAVAGCSSNGDRRKPHSSSSSNSRRASPATSRAFATIGRSTSAGDPVALPESAPDHAP